MTTQVSFQFDDNGASVEYEMSQIPRVGDEVHMYFGKMGEKDHLIARITNVRWVIVDEMDGDQGDNVTVFMEWKSGRTFYQIIKKYIHNPAWVNKRFGFDSKGEGD